ncbi:MAG: 50S ribosomal protein L11 methyltransferase [Parvibaculaceae bacterium]
MLTDQSAAPGDDPGGFIRIHTALHEPPLVPELRLHLATESDALWQMSEEDLAGAGLPPPFWAFAWAGGQALARYVLDNPSLVAGKRVLDFGSGSAIVALAALKAGARTALAADIDPFACAAAELNAAANGLSLEATARDLIGESGDWEIILVGDMCYEQPLAGEIDRWLKAEQARGVAVLLGDPGRTYLPKDRLEKLVSYAVKTSRALEDTDVRNTSVWQFS